MAKYIERNDTPMIIKIHGDAHLQPSNSTDTTKEIPATLKSKIQALLANAKVIFIGYSGNDESIYNLLDGCDNIDYVYWINQIEPTDVKVSKWWAKVKNKSFISTFDFDKVMRQIQTKFELSPPEFNNLVNKLESKYREALDEQIETSEKEPNKTDIEYLILGNDYAERKAYDKAIESYQKALAINPKNDDAYYNMGIAYRNKQAYDKAIESYQKALAINPKRDVAYTNLFELQLTQGQPFDTELEAKYIERFGNQKEKFIKYEMLQILQDIVANRRVDRDAWVMRYEGVGLGGWGFDELDVWVASMPESGTKSELAQAIEVFKAYK